jgi:hypothetical protein
MVLSYPPPPIIISHAFVSAGQRCFFTSGALCPIDRLFTDGGLAPLIPSRCFYCNDLAHRFSPLLG